MSIEGIGGRNIPSDVVFYVGLTIPDSFHSYRPDRLRGDFDIEARLTIVWQDRNSKWHKKTVGETNYSSTDQSVVKIHSGDVFNPVIPPDKIKQALDSVYKGMSAKGIDPTDDREINLMPWEGNKTFLTPLPEGDMEIVLSWIRWKRTAPSEDDITQFMKAIPKGWHATGGVDTQWNPIIIYKSGRGRLKRLEPDEKGRRSYRGYPVYYGDDENILHLPHGLSIMGSPMGSKDSSYLW